MAAAQRIYARALFEAADSAGRIDEVDRDLGGFVEALAETPELRAFLANPQLDPSAKAEVLAQITSGADDLVSNVLRLLAAKGRAGDATLVYQEFRSFVDRARGRVAVELTTAHELSDREARAIVEKIQKASGRTVEATRSVDPGLVGGMILQAGSLRVDASVRGRIERLRRELATR